MINEDTAAAPSALQLERSYEARPEELWALWTTKEGFESWWGPEGFRVEVQALEPRVGGALVYDMIAAGAEQIAFMEKLGQPVSHNTRGTFVEITPHRRLKIEHMIDFLPGVEPYPNSVVMELFEEGAKVRMVITIERYHDESFTEMATAGWESQLTKLPAALRVLADQRGAGL